MKKKGRSRSILGGSWDWARRGEKWIRKRGEGSKKGVANEHRKKGMYHLAAGRPCLQEGQLR